MFGKKTEAAKTAGSGVLTYRLLHISQIRIIPECQREDINSKVVNGMIAPDDRVEEAMGAIVCAEFPDGSFVPCDGQHRYLGDCARVDMGIVDYDECYMHAMCFVADPDDPVAHAAKVFRVMNTKKTNPTRVDLLKTGCVEGDEMSKEFTGLLESFGYHWHRKKRRAKGIKSHELGGVATIYRIYERCGAAVIAKIAAVLGDAFDGNPKMLRAYHWQGLASFFMGCERVGFDVNLTRLAEKMADRGVTYWETCTDKQRGWEKDYATELAHAYNYRLAKNRIPDGILWGSR